MKTVIVTDIHGCREELDKLLLHAELREQEDIFICLGDMMDRGPDSYGVYTRMIELRAAMRERCILIRGNHEQQLIDSVGNWDAESMWKNNGAAKTIKSFCKHGQSVWKNVSWFDQLQYYVETEDFICAHAAVEQGGADETEPGVFIWSRKIASDGEYDGKLLLYGHTPVREVLYQDGRGVEKALYPETVYTLPKTGSINLDTGCVFGNKLSAMVIEGKTFKIYQISAKS